MSACSCRLRQLKVQSAILAIIPSAFIFFLYQSFSAKLVRLSWKFVQTTKECLWRFRFYLLFWLCFQHRDWVRYNYLQLLLLLFSSQVFGSKQSIFNSVFTTNIHMLPVKVASANLHALIIAKSKGWEPFYHSHSFCFFLLPC